MAKEEEEDHRKTDETPSIIIAMKGHPGTGKSTLAQAIASSLRIPLIDKDDVRDCTFSLQQTLPPASASALLNDLSYDVIWQLASTQLKLGLGVVIDSPLSRPNHLERLIKLANSAKAGLVIVECKPSDEAEWRRRLERRGKGGDEDHPSSWHKPSTWGDLERLIEGYGGCMEYDVGDVPKLTVDTTAEVGVDDLVSDAIDFIFRRGCDSMKF